MSEAAGRHLHRRARLAFAAACGLWACATRPPPAPTIAATPAAALGSIRAQEESIVTMRARFSATTEYQNNSRRADGVLLVHKPDRFRLRLFLPFGVTVFDYVARAGRTWVTLPLATPDAPQPDVALPFSRQDFGQAFLRGPDAFPGTCQPQAVSGTEAMVVCHDRSGILKNMSVDLVTKTIIEETSLAAGVPRMVISYADYRLVEERLLPFRITMRYPATGVAADIVIQQYELNPTLPDAAFEPPDDPHG